MEVPDDRPSGRAPYAEPRATGARAPDGAAVAAAAAAPRKPPSPAEPLGEEALVSSEADLAGAEGLDPELGGWILRTLRVQQPGLEVSLSSIRALSGVIDGITARVVREAQLASGGADDADGAQGGDAAGDAGDAGGRAGGGRARGREPALTSLDIRAALRRLLPAAGPLAQPYLPTVTKRAWQLDKESLRGVKRARGAAAAAAGAPGGAGAGGAAPPPPEKENAAGGGAADAAPGGA